MKNQILVLLLLFVAAPLSAEETPKLPPGRVEIKVEDIHCGGCAKKGARKLFAVRGVSKVEWSLEKDLMIVSLSPKVETPVVKLWGATEAGGLVPEKLSFADKQFDAEAMAPLLAKQQAASTK